MPFRARIQTLSLWESRSLSRGEGYAKSHPQPREADPPARGSLKYDTVVWIAATVTGSFGVAGFGDGRQ
jgi:hypothetical protein